MEHQLIRVLPVGLTDPLPEGWDAMQPGYIFEVIEPLQTPSAIDEIIAAIEPDIIIMDADSPRGDVFELTQRVQGTEIRPAVIIISQDAAPERLRRAMLAGAEEFLSKPLDAGALRETTLTVSQNRTLRLVSFTPVSEKTINAPTPAAAINMDGIVVGVAAGKGGLGKTTIASNLALLAAKNGKRSAALIGLEGGDGAILLNLQPKLGLMDLASGEEDTAEYSIEWVRQFATTHKSGLHYWTWQGSSTRPGGTIPDDFFTKLFRTMRLAFAVTIVDLPLLTSEEASVILPQLDGVVVVSSTSDLLALRSTKTFLDLIEQTPPTNTYVVINRASSTDMISQNDFETMLDRKVVGVVANESSLTAEAINMGAPVVLMQPQSAIAGDLRSIGRVVLNLPMETTEQKKKLFGLFG